MSYPALIEFRRWFDEAAHAGISQHHGMTLATVDAHGKPKARIVLLSSFDTRGFVFHTNYLSQKGEDLLAHPNAALVFWWESLGKQVRIEGTIAKTTSAESDVYFSGRPRGSQLGAWASEQSKTISDRTVLENRLQQFTQQYVDQPVPRPPHWGGYRLIPQRFEFWHARDSRLHERIVYTLDSQQQWLTHILAP